MKPCGPGRESIPCLIKTTRREVFNTKARKETKISKYILEIMSVINRETGTSYGFTRRSETMKCR